MATRWKHRLRSALGHRMLTNETERRSVWARRHHRIESAWPADAVASTGCRSAITCLPHKSGPGNGGLEPQTQRTARLTRLSLSSFLPFSLFFSAAKPAIRNSPAQIPVVQRDLLRLWTWRAPPQEDKPGVLAREASSLVKGSQEAAGLLCHH